ncbi:MAG: hypothetical protein OXQ31_07830 [Spirochaetaceae bacterium]|nr:hypothetical protein [Spirochaetaceae bacterium]
MATLSQRTHVLEEKTDRLETVFSAFMARTDAAMARTDESFGRLERIIERREQEGAREREAAMARTDESLGRLERIIERREQEGAREREAAMARTDESLGRLECIIERSEQEGAREREAAAREREAAAREREAAAREREVAARERREMNKRWGELANKWGTVVEDIVAPSVRRLAREVFDCGRQQYFATRVSRNRSDDPAREREFDALYVGTRAVLLNETKSSPRSNDARRFARFVESGEFALYYPEYRDLPVVPVFSSLSIPEDMVTYLTRRGIYALAMGDEAMQVLNLEVVRSPHAPNA